MKKITLILVALFIGATAFAQNDLIIDRAAEANNLQASGGPISETEAQFALADFFELESSTEIQRFVFHGLTSHEAWSNGVDGFNLFIYANSGDNLPDGTPTINGGAILEYINVDPTDIVMFPAEQFANGNWANEVTVLATALDEDGITLPEGEYWLSISFNISDQNDWFYWGSNVSAEVAYNTQGYSPTGDAIGWHPAGAFYENIDKVNAMAWQMYGEQTLSVEDFETNSFKHLVKNNQLLITSDLEINNVAIYNSLGQKVVSQSVNSTDANINLGNLSSGVYFTQANVNGEMKTFKFAK